MLMAEKATIQAAGTSEGVRKSWENRGTHVAEGQLRWTSKHGSALSQPVEEADRKAQEIDSHYRQMRAKDKEGVFKEFQQGERLDMAGARSESKSDLINHILNTKYSRHHLDHWMSGKWKSGSTKASENDMNKDLLISARHEQTLNRIQANEVVMARLSGISLNDLNKSLQAAAANHASLKAGDNPNGLLVSPWVCDVIAPDHESGETWTFICQATDGKLYSAQFKLTGTQVEIVGEPKPVKATTDYEFVNAMEVAAQEVVMATWSDAAREAAAASKKAHLASAEAAGSTDFSLHRAATEAHREASEAHDKVVEGIRKADSFSKAIPHLEQARIHTKQANHHSNLAEEYDQDEYTKSVETDESTPNLVSARDSIVSCRDYGFSLTQSVKAKKIWKPGEEVQFQWMPAGIHPITASYGRGQTNVPIEMWVNCNEAGAKRIQKSFEQIMATNARRPPFICIEHQAKERAGQPLGFKWGKIAHEGGEDEGIVCTCDPSALGANNVNGRIHTSFSPTFDTDADYSMLRCTGCDKDRERCKCTSRHVYTFAVGARGSQENPAEVTRLDSQSVGSLTNWNAFKEILPVAAREPDVVQAAGSSEGAKKGWEHRHGGILPATKGAHSILAISADGRPSSTQVYGQRAQGGDSREVTAKRALSMVNDENESQDRADEYIKKEGKEPSYNGRLAHVFIHSQEHKVTHHYDLSNPQHVEDLKTMAEGKSEATKPDSKSKESDKTNAVEPNQSKLLILATDHKEVVEQAKVCEEAWVKATGEAKIEDDFISAMNANVELIAKCESALVKAREAGERDQVYALKDLIVVSNEQILQHADAVKETVFTRGMLADARVRAVALRALPKEERIEKPEPTDVESVYARMTARVAADDKLLEGKVPLPKTDEEVVAGIASRNLAINN